MKNKKIARLVLCSLFAALCFVATIVPIPVPIMHGYVNIGDCMVILCAYIAGGLYGAVAAGTGTALADITLSFALYSPATFVIKGAMAFVSSLFFRKNKTIFTIAGCLSAELIMVSGYLLYEYILYGKGCIASLPGNLIQGGINAVIAFGLITVLGKDKHIKKLLPDNEQ